jgi:hypothetical protein
MIVRPEATSACIIEIPRMRVMMMGIAAEMAAIGSHFFREGMFKLDCC